MRFVVVGAGAIGGVVGGGLAEAGIDVLLVARGAHGEAIRHHGLRIESPPDQITLKVPAVLDVSSVTFTDDDVVLLAVKSQDTHAVLSTLAAGAPAATPIVCLQNGVANEPAALRWFANVYGVCVMCPAEHLEPGVVAAYSSPIAGILDIGRIPSGTDGRAATIASHFRAAGFVAEPRPDIMRWKYAKLLINLGNAIQAICGLEALKGPITGITRAEGVACLDAAGIAYVSEDEDRQRRGDLLHIGEIAGRVRGGGSTWQSLQRRAGAVETDFLNGEIVALGRWHGIPTPVNARLRYHANRVAAAGLLPGVISAEQILDEAAAGGG